MGQYSSIILKDAVQLDFDFLGQLQYLETGEGTLHLQTKTK